MDSEIRKAGKRNSGLNQYDENQPNDKYVCMASNVFTQKQNDTDPPNRDTNGSLGIPYRENFLSPIVIMMVKKR